MAKSRTKPTRPARSSRVRVERFYRDKRGNAHDADSNVIVSEAATKGATEVEPPEASRVDEAAASDASRKAPEDLGDGSAPTPDPAAPTAEAVPDLPPPPTETPMEAPTAAPTAPVVERASDGIPDLPEPPQESQGIPGNPSAPPSAPPSASPSAPAIGVPSAPPTAQPMAPGGAPQLERAPAPPPMAAPQTAAGAEAVALGIATGNPEDCPHCETDIKVCPRCGKEYAPVSRDTAQVLAVLVGKLSGTAVRAWASRKYGFAATPANLSSAEIEALTTATHNIMRRRLPAKAGGAVGDFLAGGLALIGSAACQIQDAIQEARAAEVSRPPAPAPRDASPPAPAPVPERSPTRFGSQELPIAA